MKTETKLLFRDESYAIMGACFAVHNDKGDAFHEPVYQEYLEIELMTQGIPFIAQREFPLFYRGRKLRQSFKVDFVCYDQIVLEIKAVSALADEHRAQVINYLAASGKELGLLVNFGHHPKLEYERIVLSEKRQTGRVESINLQGRNMPA